MKVHLIKERLEKYKAHLRSVDFMDSAYKWDAYRHFKDNWDVEALDFRSMFEKSFGSEKSLRLWKKENYFPKEMMLRFIDNDKEFVRVMFWDLLDESKDIEMRIDRFKLYCDEMLIRIQREDMKAADHFHGNYEMIFVYLCFIYPDRYCLYNFDAYRQFMVNVESKNVPRFHSPLQYVKMMKAVRKIMEGDEELTQIRSQVLAREELPADNVGIWVGDFLDIV